VLTICSGVALWCNNCSTPSGEVSPYFEYQIDTSFDSALHDIISLDSLESIIPIAKLGFTVLQTIEARLNLELETRVGVEVDCSFPFGANCSASFNAGGKFHPDTGKQQSFPVSFISLLASAATTNRNLAWIYGSTVKFH